MRNRGIIIRETATQINAKCLNPEKTKGTHTYCDDCQVHRKHIKSGKYLHCDCRYKTLGHPAGV